MLLWCHLLAADNIVDDRAPWDEIIADFTASRTHPAKLSITHISCGSDFRTEFDIGETGETAPDDDDAGWRIAGTCQIIAKASELCDVVCQRALSAASIARVGDEVVENADLGPG